MNTLLQWCHMSCKLISHFDELLENFIESIEKKDFHIEQRNPEEAH